MYPGLEESMRREFIVKLGPRGTLPTKGTEESAGYDLYAACDLSIDPGQVRAVPLDIYTEIPKGYYGRIADRSGLAFKSGLTVLGGVIDCDYRGEWKVLIHNTQEEWYLVEKGQRIAQVVLTPCANFPVSEAGRLSDTARGSGGFGSTGV